MFAHPRTALLAGLLAAAFAGAVLAQAPEAPAATPPIAADNSISGMSVTREPDGTRRVTFDYVYMGPNGGATLHVQQYTKDAQTGELRPVGPEHAGWRLGRGGQRMSVQLIPPAGDQVRFTWVAAELRIDSKVVARQLLDPPVDWVSSPYAHEARPGPKVGNDELLARAVNLIDHGRRSSLDEAKRLLERITLNDPRADAAYIELARVAMKTNWGPNGLRQAETLLKSALEIKPDSANAKILLGYVHAHQRKYSAAEVMFRDAARSEPRNLWLWANWGELLAMQGERTAAIAKYREAVSRPRTYDTYDRARLDAYQKLLGLLERDSNLDAMEALHRQRSEEFGQTTCARAEYASFMLNRRQQADAAITLARAALDSSCDETLPRDVLGAAHYTLWATTTGPRRNESLNQARIFLPIGPRAFYVLAGSDTTSAAAKQLVAGGEAVDQQDNDHMTALGFALQADDLDAARRLLRLGAKPTATVGQESMSVALVPVMKGSVAGIQLLQGAGVDYTQVRYQGTRAIDIARQMGLPQVIDALEGKGKAL